MIRLILLCFTGLHSFGGNIDEAIRLYSKSQAVMHNAVNNAVKNLLTLRVNVWIRKMSLRVLQFVAVAGFGLFVYVLIL